MNLALTTKYQRASQTTRDQLILENVDYVGRILSTMNFMVTDSDARENLQSAGILGLVQAANNFDAKKGVPFRTFAYPRIRGAIIDELRSQSLISQRTLKMIGLVRKTYEGLEPPVTPEILAKRSSLTLAEVIECLEALRFIKPDDWDDLSDVVHSSWRHSQNGPEHSIETEELTQLIAKGIETLPEKERLVLTLYYSKELKLAEIGAVMDLSESRVSRILASGKFRLQEVIRCKTE